MGSRYKYFAPQLCFTLPMSTVAPPTNKRRQSLGQALRVKKSTAKSPLANNTQSKLAPTAKAVSAKKTQSKPIPTNENKRQSSGAKLVSVEAKVKPTTSAEVDQLKERVSTLESELMQFKALLNESMARISDLEACLRPVELAEDDTETDFVRIDYDNDQEDDTGRESLGSATISSPTATFLNNKQANSYRRSSAPLKGTPYKTNIPPELLPKKEPTAFVPNRRSSAQDTTPKHVTLPEPVQPELDSPQLPREKASNGTSLDLKLLSYNLDTIFPMMESVRLDEKQQVQNLLWKGVDLDVSTTTPRFELTL